MKFLSLLSLVLGVTRAHALSCSVLTSVHSTAGSGGSLSPSIVDISPDRPGTFTSGSLTVEMKQVKENLVVQATVGSTSQFYSEAISSLPEEISIKLPMTQNAFSEVTLSCK